MAGSQHQHGQGVLDDTSDLTHVEEEMILDPREDVNMMEDQAAIEGAEPEDEKLADDDGKVAHDQVVVESMVEEYMKERGVVIPAACQRCNVGEGLMKLWLGCASSQSGFWKLWTQEIWM